MTRTRPHVWEVEVDSLQKEGKSWLPSNVISTPTLLVDFCPGNKGKAGKRIRTHLPRDETRPLSSKIRHKHKLIVSVPMKEAELFISLVFMPSGNLYNVT